MSVGLLVVRLIYGLYVVQLSKFVSFFLFVTQSMSGVSCRFTLAANGLRLGVVADFHHKCLYEAHTSNIAKMFLRRTTTAITPNRC